MSARDFLFTMFCVLVVVGAWRPSCLFAAALCLVCLVAISLLYPVKEEPPENPYVLPDTEVEKRFKEQASQIAELRSEMNALNMRAGLGKKT